MRKRLAACAVVLTLALTGCGSYIQLIERDGVHCIIKRAEWNNTIQSVKCPNPFTTNNGGSK